jgi:iron complex transport system permease protein
MLFASVITAVCVAFVGVIGFIGLVVPHICRMILGGDHRLILPASIAIGGFMMLVADLIARMVITQSELPVGAITALIGVPLFAFLLMKKGRMYDG